jgi:hypothetical protein
MTGKNAFETLMRGEADAMEQMLQSAAVMDRIAKTLDARFAAIEGRLKALEEAHEALSRRTGFGGVVSDQAGATDGEQLP